MGNENEITTLMGLTAEFVKTLNSAIPSFDLKDLSELQQIQFLQQRIGTIMNKFERSEENASLLLEQLEKSTNECQDVVYIRKDSNLKAIISRDIIKPIIRPVEKLEIECNCVFKNEGKFAETEGYFLIENEEKLRKLDESLRTVILGIFDHDYRVYDPFTCVLAIYVPEGYIYIVDAIKFRHIIPTLRLFKCGIQKIFTSQYDVERAFKDFGSIGCYTNFNIPLSDVFVDWRIRPFNDIFTSLICDSMIKAAEKINMGIATEAHIPVEKDTVAEFLNEFNLSELSLELVEDLFKFREYLAKKNDEGAQYVMTDKQLFNLIVNMPSSLEEFEALFDRMSAVLRLHAGDFLIILNRKSKIFSLEKLKSKQPENGSVGADSIIKGSKGYPVECCKIEESQESELEISEE